MYDLYSLTIKQTEFNSSDSAGRGTFLQNKAPRSRGLNFWIDSPCDKNTHLSCGSTTAVKSPEIDPATPHPRWYASLVALGDGKSCTRTEGPVNKFSYLWTLLTSGGKSGSQISARDLLKWWRECGGWALLFEICSCWWKIWAKGKSSSVGWIWFEFMDLREGRKKRRRRIL